MSETAPLPARDWVILAAILLLALILRIVGLNAPLWYDEIATVQNHLRLPWSQFLDHYHMNNHYLFNAQAKLSIEVFGEAPWTVRLPAMLFGLGNIAAAWWLTRMISTPRFAHVTAALLALSYHHIWFSQNARGYSEMAFWGALGTILFLRGMARPRPAVWLWYGVVLALAVFTHLTAAFLFATHGLFWLGAVAFNRAGGTRRDALLWPLAGYFLGAVLTALAYAPMMSSLIDVIGNADTGSAVSVMKEYQSPIWSVLEGIRTGLGAAGPLVALVAVAVLALSVVGAFVAHAREPLYAPIVFAHIVLSIVLLKLVGMRIWPRFFFPDIALMMPLLVLGVWQVSGWLASLLRGALGQVAVFRIGVVLMLLISAALAVRNYTLPKQNLAGAVAVVAEVRQPGEPVYAAGQGWPIFDGYFNTGWLPMRDEAEFDAAEARPGSYLVVVVFPTRTFRKIPGLDALSENGMTLVRRLPGTLGDGAVLIFRRQRNG